MPSESDGRLVAVYVVVYVVVKLLQYPITKLVRCVCLLLQDLSCVRGGEGDSEGHVL